MPIKHAIWKVGAQPTPLTAASLANEQQLEALVDALNTSLAASRATAANLLTAHVAELTGTTNDGKFPVPTHHQASAR